MKLFEKIREMVEDDDTFVCVLIGITILGNITRIL